jgi:hypothetical protein
MITADLFQVWFNQNKLQTKKVETCSINKCLLLIHPIAGKLGSEESADPIVQFLTEHSEHEFDYTYNVPMYPKLKNDKKRILNVKITYSKVHYQGSSFTHSYFAHFSSFNKVMNSFYHKRLWIQQSQNIMWLTNIIILILACIAAFANVFV